MSPGLVLGFSVNPRTVQNLKKGMAKTQSEQCPKQLQEVLNVLNVLSVVRQISPQVVNASNRFFFFVVYLEA